jgi:capsular polysaccharide biosynthesis protein
VLHPQEMTLSDQLQAYHDAGVLAGPYGSQMHNILFAGRGARVIVLNEINNLQRLLCEWLGQDLTVILPDDGVPRTHEDLLARPSEAAYRVDPADVASVLDHV